MIGGFKPMAPVKELLGAVGTGGYLGNWPRITELIGKGALEQKGKTTCAITGRTVRLVGLKQQEAF